jgi:hypothetical protein
LANEAIKLSGDCHVERKRYIHARPSPAALDFRRFSLSGSEAATLTQIHRQEAKLAVQAARRKSTEQCWALHNKSFMLEPIDEANCMS